MISLIEVRPPKKRWGWTVRNGENVWEIECDVCGKTEHVTKEYYSYGFGEPGIPGPHDGKMKSIGYGKVNPRMMISCRDHRDSEVAAKIKELE